MTWTEPPTKVTELEPAIHAVQRAAQGGDRAALERRFRRLDLAMRAYRPSFLKHSAGLDPDELHQRVLIRVRDHFERAPAEPIRDPRAWLATIAARVALDEHRARNRHRLRHADDDNGENLDVHEHSGVFVRADFLAELESEERALEAAFAHYATAAVRFSPRARAQIWTVYYAKIRGEQPAEVAERLRDAQLGSPDNQLVWQWLHRGAELLARLCAQDTDVQRARLVREALKKYRGAA